MVFQVQDFKTAKSVAEMVAWIELKPVHLLERFSLQISDLLKELHCVLTRNSV